MSGTPNKGGKRASLEATSLLARCGAVLDGHDLAAVLGVLTTLVTVTLADANIPLDVFIDGLRESDAKLAALRKEHDD